MPLLIHKFFSLKKSKILKKNEKILIFDIKSRHFGFSAPPKKFNFFKMKNMLLGFFWVADNESVIYFAIQYKHHRNLGCK